MNILKAPYGAFLLNNVKCNIRRDGRVVDCATLEIRILSSRTLETLYL